MSNTPQKPRVSPTLVGGGILVVALGFGLPMLTSGLKTGAAPDPAPHESAKEAPPASPASKSLVPMEQPSTAGLGASLMRLVVVLVVVCGACVLVAKWVGNKPAQAPGAMESLASIRVAQCVVHLVRAGDRRLLVGTDFAGVKSVLELPVVEPDSVPEPAPPAEAPHPPAPAEGAATPEQLMNLLLRLRGQVHASPPA